MKRDLFASGAAARLAAVGIWLVAGAAAIVAVERTGNTGAPPRDNAAPVAEPEASSSLITLTITATYDVDAWEVLSAGKPVDAASLGEREWTGSVPAGREVFIEARPADLLADQIEALIVESSDQPDARIFRGEGAASGRFTPEGGAGD